MSYLSKDDMFRLGRGIPTKEALAKIDTLDILDFTESKRNGDFRMFLKRIVGINNSYSDAMDLKRTQEWACGAMYTLIMAEREEEARDANEEDEKKTREAGSKDVEAEKTKPVFDGDDLIAF
ncbi:hypothetical protein ACHAPU_002038 [Fusarium lateritium]